MEPCVAYESVPVMQICPAYEIVSDSSQKDQMLQEVTRNGQRDEADQLYY